MSQTPRGIRNNNPGNVDYHPSSDPWRGLDEPPTDGRFCRFITPEFGIRVMAKLLLAYQDYHRLFTVRGIINRWAPPNENATDEYVKGVAAALHVGPDETISVRAPHLMAGLVKAIIRHENGQQPYSDEVIDRGVAMAGDVHLAPLVQPPPPVVPVAAPPPAPPGRTPQRDFNGA